MRGYPKIKLYTVYCILFPSQNEKRKYHDTFLPKTLHNPNKCLTLVALEPAKPLNDAQMSGSFFLLDMKTTFLLHRV